MRDQKKIIESTIIEMLQERGKGKMRLDEFESFADWGPYFISMS